MRQRVNNFCAAYRNVVLSGGIPEKLRGLACALARGFCQIIRGKPVNKCTSRGIEEHLKLI